MIAGEDDPTLHMHLGKRAWLADRNSVLVDRAWVGPFSNVRGGQAGVDVQWRAAAVAGPKRRGQVK